MVAKIYLDESVNLIDIEIEIINKNSISYHDVFVINKRDTLKKAIDVLHEINELIASFDKLENLYFVERKPNISLLNQKITDLIFYKN